MCFLAKIGKPVKKNLKTIIKTLAPYFKGVYVCVLMGIIKHIILLATLVGLLFACKPKQGQPVATQGKDTTTFSVYKVEQFFAYPVSKRRPIIIDTGKPEEDKKIYNLRLQHWYLIYNTNEYEKTYGALPKFYPGNVTLEEYKKHPPQPPDEYNKIMFGK